MKHVTRPRDPRAVRARITASNASLVEACRRHPEALARSLRPELLRPPAPVATADIEKVFTRRRKGPASWAGLYMAVLAVGLALCAANPRIAAAKGGLGIVLLHVLGTGLFGWMLLLEPWRIRNHKLRVAAAVLGTSTFLEAWFADYPWHTVQVLIRSGCGIVAVSMASLVICTFQPRRKMKGFFLAGLLTGATGSLIVSIGAAFATQALYRSDHAGAVANLIVAVGALGLGLKCLGLRLLNILRPIPPKPRPPCASTIKDHLKSTSDLLELSENQQAAV